MIEFDQIVCDSAKLEKKKKMEKKNQSIHFINQLKYQQLTYNHHGYFGENCSDSRRIIKNSKE